MDKIYNIILMLFDSQYIYLGPGIELAGAQEKNIQLNCNPILDLPQNRTYGTAKATDNPNLLPLHNQHHLVDGSVVVEVAEDDFLMTPNDP